MKQLASIAILVAVCAVPSAAQVTITHGPIVGNVTPNGATIFLRTSAPAQVALEFARLADLDETTMTAEWTTSDASDLTVHIPLQGLVANTRYYYTPHIDGEPLEPRLIPSFRTSPHDDEVSESFRFVVTGDAERGQTRGAHVYRELVDAEPAFLIQLGDFDHRNPAWQGDTPDIENWRIMHRDMVRDSPLGDDFFRHIGHSFPCYPMWDDHDYGHNNADKNAPWKPIALQAFQEYHPLPPLPSPDAGLWYRFRYAQAEFFVLDLRSQRDPHTDPDGLDKSMLDGDDIPGGQQDWLLEGLRESTATWKFILSTVPFNPTVQKPDAWMSYEFERQRLLHFVDTHEISGVIIISADIHSGGGIDDGFNAGLPEMTVPHLNLNHVPDSGCTANDCGSWSHGISDGATGSSTNSGFGVVQVSYNKVSGHKVALQTRSDHGAEKHTLRVQLGDAPGASSPGLTPAP